MKTQTSCASTGVKQGVGDPSKLRLPWMPHQEPPHGSVCPGSRRWLLLAISSPGFAPGLKGFQGKPTFLVPGSYAGPSEFAVWDGMACRSCRPVLGTRALHDGAASTMDPDENSYFRSWGTYTLTPKHT